MFIRVTIFVETLLLLAFLQQLLFHVPPDLVVIIQDLNFSEPPSFACRISFTLSNKLGNFWSEYPGARFLELGLMDMLLYLHGVYLGESKRRHSHFPFIFSIWLVVSGTLLTWHWLGIGTEHGL